MNWNWVESLESEDLIKEYEETVGYTFPDEYKEIVKNYNGAYPEFKEFKSRQGRRKSERVFNNLLSFNKNDRVNMWRTNDNIHRIWAENGELDNYIVFANDPFGNKICFDKTNDHIVFIDHETLSIEPVATSFAEFIASLKKIR